MSRSPKAVASAVGPRLVDGSGAPFALGAEIGRGGEGAVFATAHGAVVAKVYTDPPKADGAKLVAMAPLAARMEAFAAWPREVLRDARTGAVAGFTMRRAGGDHDIHDLYNVKSRRRHFPKADWRFLVHVAANVCRAFGAVHAAGCVVGDVNHGGIRVAQDGTVTLIDCDSMQVTGGGRTYRCKVGVDTFTPPELQGARFADIDRTVDHDGFGLAILLFQLLFLGRHPFIGVFTGTGDMEPARAIREHRFAFGGNAGAVMMRPPPGSVGMDVAGPEASALFERAFSRDAPLTGRPSPREWLDVLGRIESALVACKADPGHWHAPGDECPWCRLERSSGVQIFPVLVRRLAQSLFDMPGFERALAAIGHPGPLPDLYETEIAKPAGGRLRGRVARAVAFLAMALTWAGAYALGSVLLLLASLPVYGIVRFALRNRRKARELKALRDVAVRRWEAAWEEWVRRAGPAQFDAVYARIVARGAEWRVLPGEHEKRMRRLTSNLEVDQRARFLDRFPIASARIEGIGPIRSQTLESFGISTAADVEEAAVLNVPGFGPARFEALQRWRRSVEKGFTFDPKRGADPQDIAKAEAEGMRRRNAVEADLASGLAELRQIARRIDGARSDLRPAVEAAHAAMRQAKAHLDAAS